MDSDPIIYGEAPEHQNSNDGEPQPKRARLDLEHDGGRASTPELLLKDAEEPRITPPEKTPEAADDNLDHPPTHDALPGLFLVGGDVLDKNTVETAINHAGDDHENDGDQAGGEAEHSAGEICENEIASEEDKGAIRNLDDFLEKGRANLGDPEAEWQLDSSADEEENGNKNRSRRSTPRSSPSSDDSDSTSSESDSERNSGSDEEEDEGEDAIFLDIQKEAKRLMDEDGGSDDEGGNDHKRGTSGPLRTKNELPETRSALVRPNIDVSASTPVVHLGVIDSVVDDLVLVKAAVSGEYQVLNEQSLLCFEDRSILGQVQETFGRVEQPFYTIRLRDAAEAEALNATVGRKVHYIPSHSTFLFTKTIRAMKGSDASNLHDEEVGDDEREFSDDEAEAEFKRRQKEEKKAKGSQRAPGPSAAPDVMDEPYVPLSRPANLHEMSAPPGQGNLPQRREVPPRGPARDYQASRGFRGRGRGRGGRQPPGRPDPKPNHRHHNHSPSHQRSFVREERSPMPRPEPQPATNHQQHDAAPRQSPPVPQPPPVVQPPPDLSAFLPFLNPTQLPPQIFSSGAHINPAFFPMPVPPQLPFAGPLGQMPPPPHPLPLPLNPAQFPLLNQARPPSVEEILIILRSQGHNV
ncbi:hypothetical protein Dda_8769 [Drechslerella dactyloides]|uniref:H/ACA ribonucleoprotein complex non-core subunit NAF1 n=1 Tax=Drechslerella dactyloides TaxID=74499 RepID=A0AAD6ITR9_DREDA|nr:hypothetical protein Dda_8769 [Drechslerella dactyloides]